MLAGSAQRRVVSGRSASLLTPQWTSSRVLYTASRYAVLVDLVGAARNQSQEPVAAPGRAVSRSEVIVARRPSGGTAAGLLGAGVVAGLGGCSAPS